jgi:hypothetical protein
MMSNVVSLYPPQPLLAGYLRVGHDGHRRLPHMLSVGRLKYKRFVFEAAYIETQTELLKALISAGCEIVLDTNFTEMFFDGKQGSTITKLPWANHDRPWQPADFQLPRNFDAARQIAEFATKYSINSIISPSHVVGPANVATSSFDRLICESLRMELDKLGQQEIKLDFQLSLAASVLGDQISRQSLVGGLTDLPIDNLWLRIENFGASSTGAAIQKVVNFAKDFHECGKPLIVDYAGGLAGLATLSLGTAGSLCHGIGMKENFDLSHWKNKPSGSGGNKYVYVSELDKKFKPKQLQLFLDARGSKSKFSCNNQECCVHANDMTDRHDEHFITQRSKQLQDLARFPADKRTEHFLLNHVGAAVRMGELSTKLKIDDEALSKALVENKKRLQRMQEALMTAARGNLSFSKVPVFRGGKNKINAVMAQ